MVINNFFSQTYLWHENNQVMLQKSEVNANMKQQAMCQYNLIIVSM